MIARTANAYEQQLTQVFGKVKGASRGAWLAGLGAVARVQSRAPRYMSGLVKDGERFEGRALKSASEIIATIKDSRGYEVVQKAPSPTSEAAEGLWRDGDCRAHAPAGNG
jgi:poly(hydroxyalkanoate) granule-associated protein